MCPRGRAGRCIGLSLDRVDPRQTNVAISRSIRWRNGRTLKDASRAGRIVSGTTVHTTTARDHRAIVGVMDAVTNPTPAPLPDAEDEAHDEEGIA